MNSLERRELRYQRRKKLREDKIINKCSLINIDNCFKFSKVYYYAKKCTKNVGYKKSTINFKLHMFSIVSSTCVNIKNNNYKVSDTYKFKINERGKERIIDAPTIKDRLVHKVISNEVLIPLYDSKLIYDNGASCICKGFSFTLKRVKLKLLEWYKKYGLNGYVILIDYSKFFENCDHKVIRDIHKKYIRDEYLIKVIEDYLFINKGLSLGIEIAQREALMYPNNLDKYIINKGLPIIRYMDDTLIICHSYNEALDVLNKYKIISMELNIKINSNKTIIVNLNRCFKFCNWKFKLLDNGNVYYKVCRNTIYRQRRKIVKMFNNCVNIIEIYNTIVSFKAYLKLGYNYFSIKYLELFYFLFPKIGKNCFLGNETL